MRRDDFDRRRLRSLYDRNRSRVSALADARDRRRGGDDSYAAPRRYVVSERRTHIEGFGRGGTQVRRVERRVVRLADAPRSRRFSDRGIFRRGGRDRFRRADDFEREDRRDRFRGSRDRRGEGRREEGGGRRFGESRRARLRMRSRRGGRRAGNGGAREDNRAVEERRQRGSRRGGESGRKNVNNNSNNGNRGSNAKNGGSNKGNNSQPRRTREPPMTREQLDRQLENYHN